MYLTSVSNIFTLQFNDGNVYLPFSIQLSRSPPQVYVHSSNISPRILLDWSTPFLETVLQPIKLWPKLFSIVALLRTSFAIRTPFRGSRMNIGGCSVNVAVLSIHDFIMWWTSIWSANLLQLHPLLLPIHLQRRTRGIHPQRMFQHLLAKMRLIRRLWTVPT